MRSYCHFHTLVRLKHYAEFFTRPQIHGSLLSLRQFIHAESVLRNSHAQISLLVAEIQNDPYDGVLFSHKRNEVPEFPGGAVDRNLPANAGDVSSIPGLGRSHTLRTDMPCATAAELEL